MFDRRPSAAMVVAVIAVVVAMTGTGVAGEIAGTSSLDRREKKQVRKLAKQVANARITARAPRLSVASARSADRATAADTATSATTAANATTAGSAARLTSLLWAVVNADGTLARSSAGITGSVPGAGAGQYVVTADRDVSQCAYQVSIEGNDPGDTDNGETSANPESGSANAAAQVRVGTFGPDGTPVNEGFMLLITC